MTRPPGHTLDWKPLRFEQLEHRCAMAADLLPADTRSAAFFDGHTYQRNDILMGSTITIDLATELQLKSARITSITTKGVGELSVRDQGALVYKAPTSLLKSFERAESTVTLLDAANREFQVVVRLFVRPPAERPYFAEEPVEIRIEAVDSEGEKITHAGRGDEFYVVATVADQRVDASGVFGAYLDISFDSHNLTVIGKPQSLGPYTNGVRAQVTSNGVLAAGGFAKVYTPLGAEPRSLVKFLVRVNDDGPIRVSARPSTTPGDELLLFDIDFPVQPLSVRTANLELASAPAAAPSNSQADSTPSSPSRSARPLNDAIAVPTSPEEARDLFFLQAIPGETIMPTRSEDQPAEPAWNLVAPQVFASAADQNFGQGWFDNWLDPKRRWRS